MPRNFNLVPFRIRYEADANHATAFNLVLRTGSPVANRSCYRTRLHFSLQRSHLNNCYYHQDLHWVLLHRASRQGFLASTYAVLH